MGNHRHLADHFDYRSDNNLRIKSTQPELKCHDGLRVITKEIPKRVTDVLQGIKTPTGKTSQQNRAGCFIRPINRGTDHAMYFYVTNYVVQPELTGDMLPTPSGLAIAKTPATTVNGATSSAPPASQESEQPTVSADAPTLRAKFADKFTSGAVEKTDTSYKSANINVSINKVQKKRCRTYFWRISMLRIFNILRPHLQSNRM
jgi:hypothetical protein